jgi:hypothetical protein
MLKFENTANIGDIIKAFDFKPMADRPDSFLTGRVVEKGEMFQDFDGRKVYIGNGYTVEVLGGDSESAPIRKGQTMYVPFEVDFMEYDERVEVVATEAEIEMLIAFETNEAIH